MRIRSCVKYINIFFLNIIIFILASCSNKVQTKTIVLKDNNNQPYTKVVKVVKSAPINGIQTEFIKKSEYIQASKNNGIYTFKKKLNISTNYGGSEAIYDSISVLGYVLLLIAAILGGIVCVAITFITASILSGILATLLFLGIIYVIIWQIIRIVNGEA